MKIRHLPYCRVPFGWHGHARIGRDLVRVRKLIPLTRLYAVTYVRTL
jgi:hypothetical protein